MGTTGLSAHLLIPTKTSAAAAEPVLARLLVFVSCVTQ